MKSGSVVALQRSSLCRGSLSLLPLAVALPQMLQSASARCASQFSASGLATPLTVYLQQIETRVVKFDVVLVTVKLRMRAGAPP